MDLWSTTVQPYLQVKGKELATPPPFPHSASLSLPPSFFWRDYHNHWQNSVAKVQLRGEATTPSSSSQLGSLAVSSTVCLTTQIQVTLKLTVSLSCSLSTTYYLLIFQFSTLKSTSTISIYIHTHLINSTIPNTLKQLENAFLVKLSFFFLPPSHNSQCF